MGQGQGETAVPERKLLTLWQPETQCLKLNYVHDLCVYVIVCSSVMQILQLAYFIFVSLNVIITY